MKPIVRAFTLALSALLALSLLGKPPVQAQGLPTIQLPDLYIVSTKTSQDEATGQWYVAVLVSNKGDAASVPCTLRATHHTGLFTTIAGHVAEALYDTYTPVATVKPLQQVWVIVNAGWSYPTGQWWQCRVDGSNDNAEWNENNNTKNHYF